MTEEHKEQHKEEMKHTKKRKKLTKGFLVGFFAGLILAGLCFGGYWMYGKVGEKMKNLATMDAGSLSIDEIKKTTTDFINEKLMNGGKIKDLSILDKKAYYNLKIDIDGTNSVETIVSADGTKFCVSAMEIEKKKEVVKADKPNVELFVMSHCPYGTQIEKGIIPAIEALGDKVDFSLKFCSYAMHGEEELKEQLNQYCIQKEQKDKLIPYLKCFLSAGNSASCVVSTGVDKAKMDACATSSDKEFSVMANFKNKIGYQGDFPGFTVFQADNEKYKVQGSPTLVINGSINENAGRSSADLLKAICETYNNAPEGCKASLSPETPAPGFGSASTSATNSNAGCSQ
ncbi:hypothetical protein M0R01_00635 [bacterium]|nr:hypothetical protein [bacterium]